MRCPNPKCNRLYVQGSAGGRRLLCPDCIQAKKRQWEADRTIRMRVDHSLRAVKVWVHHEPYERMKRIAVDRGVSVSVLFQEMITTRVAEEGDNPLW